MSWIYYLLEANLYLALFYAVYYLLLRRDTYYQLNRGYLLGSSLLAFVIPLMQLGFLKPVEIAAEQITQVSFVPAIPTSHIIAQTPVTAPVVTVNYYLLVYISIAVLMSVSFAFRIFQLSRLARKGKQLAGKNFRIIEMDDEGRAFSFFSYLFISKKLTASDTIIQHELVHIRQKHSLDIIYLELLKIICWFNPAVYLMQNSIRELHEYIADNQVAVNQRNVNEYTDFLVSNAYGLPEPLLANSFFNKNLLKNRIMMLHQKRSGVLARLKLLVALPLLAGMLCLSTLGFTKDYYFIDLLPANRAVKQPDVPVLPPPPPPPAKFSLTKKGYTYGEVAYAVNGKKYFYVRIMGPDSVANDYGSNTITAAQTKALKEKFGYTFPSQNAINKMHPVAEYLPKHVTQPLQSPTPIQPPAVSKDAYIGLETYMQKNYSYPAMAYKNRKTGAVVLDFVLDKKGMINDIKVAKGIGEGLDEEAIRLFHNYKKPVADNPGYHTLAIIWNIKGKPVTDAVPAEIRTQPNFEGEFYLPGTIGKSNGNAVTTESKPKVDRVRFPPPVVKTNANMPAPPKPKVDQVRFPPPVLKNDTTKNAAYQSFYRYIATHLKYLKEAREQHIQGRVFVEFNVDNDHKIRNITILRGLSDEQDAEVVKTIKSAFVPIGMKSGINYTIPIFFSLTDAITGKDVDSKPFINPHPAIIGYKHTGYKEISLSEIVVGGTSLAPAQPADEKSPSGQPVKTPAHNNGDGTSNKSLKL